uniref:DM2 domain-containing protein n=1 Tax=viral metagenome TaxID=1070528 RepID=A0A6C0CZ86_9ZZZZ
MTDVVSTNDIAAVPVIAKVKKTVTRKKKTVTSVDGIPSSLPPAVLVTPVTPTVEVTIEEAKLTNVPVPVPISEVCIKTEIMEEVVIPVASPILEENTSTISDVIVDEKKKPAKRVATKEKLLSDMDTFYNKIKPILEAAPGSKQNLKDVIRIQSDMRRILKVRNPDKKVKDNTNSGFMKPIRVSEELRRFLEADGGMTDTITRAYLTTRLCNYIKKNNLQNPDDKRIIFPDENLVRLFAIQENEQEPLTYYNIQKRIQRHIFRLEEETTA